MSKPIVWISRPFFPDIVDRLRPWFEVRAETEERSFSPAELAGRLAGADAAIVGLAERIDAAAIASAPRLRFVANLGVGYNNLDIDALTEAGIGASNTPDVLNETVADYAWALMLAAARRDRRSRALAARRPVARFALRRLAGRRRAWQDHRYPRHGPDRPGHRTACVGVPGEGDLSQPFPAGAGNRA